MSLIELPAHVRMNMQREAAVDKHLQAAVELATALRKLDPRLELWKASDRLPEPIHGAIPGYWHVVRKSDPPTPDTYLAITTQGLGKKEGGFREPDFGVLRELEEMDMQGRNYDLPSDNYDEVEAAVEKERAKQRERESDEVLEHFKAAKRVAGDGGLEKRLFGKGAVKLNDAG